MIVCKKRGHHCLFWKMNDILIVLLPIANLFERQSNIRINIFALLLKLFDSFDVIPDCCKVRRTSSVFLFLDRPPLSCSYLWQIPLTIAVGNTSHISSEAIIWVSNKSGKNKLSSQWNLIKHSCVFFSWTVSSQLILGHWLAVLNFIPAAEKWMVRKTFLF